MCHSVRALCVNHPTTVLDAALRVVGGHAVRAVPRSLAMTPREEPAGCLVHHRTHTHYPPTTIR